jgi:hypothetical protein
MLVMFRKFMSMPICPMPYLCRTYAYLYAMLCITCDLSCPHNISTEKDISYHVGSGIVAQNISEPIAAVD